MANWLLLHYKVPREPSANRVYVWRKLKRLGAILLHDAIWILPDNPRTQEQFQWLAVEISELEGEALVWTANLAQNGQGQESGLITQFLTQTNEIYSQILTELQAATQEKNQVDITALARRYQQARQTDYFNSPPGQKIREIFQAIEATTPPDENTRGKSKISKKGEL